MSRPNFVATLSVAQRKRSLYSVSIFLLSSNLAHCSSVNPGLTTTGTHHWFLGRPIMLEPFWGGLDALTRDDVSQVIVGWKHKSTFAFPQVEPSFLQTREREPPTEAKDAPPQLSCEVDVIEIHGDMFQPLQYVFNCSLKDSQGG